MPRNKIKVNETLDSFLFNQIENDSEFLEFVENYEIPEYITSNISRTLRPYQELALKHFIYLFEKDKKQAKHLLFNMATGTGKSKIFAINTATNSYSSTISYNSTKTAIARMSDFFIKMKPTSRIRNAD